MKAQRPEGFDQWRPARFEVAAANTAYRVTGWEYRGLGLDLRSSCVARYRRKDGTRKRWSIWPVTHLNTGHAVRLLQDVPAERAFALATGLAELGDWTFNGFDGWRNREPELAEKLADWHERNDLGARQAGGGRHEEIARAIGMARW